MPITIDGETILFPPETEGGMDDLRLASAQNYEQELWTYQDAVEHVLDVYEVPRDSRALRNARRAVLNAHRTLPTMHQWPYYLRQLVLHLNAPQSSSSIDYDYTGGTYERLVTLASGTWPAWADKAVLRIGNIDYPVQKRIDSTRLTLDSRRCPIEDLNDEDYTLYQSRYALPVDFRRHDRVLQPDTMREMMVTSQSLIATTNIFQRGLSTPYQAAIVEDEKHVGALAMQFNPPMSSDTTLVMLYERAPRPLKTEKEATGTISATEDSATITGSGTAFADAHYGAVLRIGEDASEPTSKVGSLVDDTINEAAYTRIVIGRTSATSITVDEAIPETLSGRGFTISDPVDVHVGSMFDAFLRLAEFEFARLMGRDDLPERRAMWIEQLNIARDAARHSTPIQSANIGETSGYSIMGNVNVRPDL